MPTADRGRGGGGFLHLPAVSTSALSKKVKALAHPDSTRPRTDDEMNAAARVLRQFVRAGHRLIPLVKGGKVPREEGWQASSYSLADIGHWMKQGGNAGVRLRDADLVLDVDPRHFAPGDDPLRRLCDDVGFDLRNAPTVLTGRGDGGRHIYFRKPADLRVAGKAEGYKGIDLRSAGSFVVAPGSRHPDTGRAYELDDLAPPISTVVDAPDALLALIARTDNAARVGGEGVGKLPPEQLADFLAVLDPRDYGKGKHDRWLRLMAACHDATAGSGLIEWLEFCARDPDYANDADQEMTARRWSSFEAGKVGGADYRTLFRAVVDAGRPDLVAAFDGDDDDFPAIEIGTEDFPAYDFGDEP